MKNNKMITLGEICSVYISSKVLTEKTKEFIKIILDYKKKHNCF